MRYLLSIIAVLLAIAASGCSTADSYETIYYGLKKEVNNVEIRMAALHLEQSEQLAAKDKQYIIFAVNVVNYGSDPKVVEPSMFTFVDDQGNSYSAVPEKELPDQWAEWALLPGTVFQPYKKGAVTEHLFFAYEVPDTIEASRESTIPGHYIVYKDGKDGLRFSFDKRCISQSTCFE